MPGLPETQAFVELAYDHRGLSFVHILQRCPTYTAAVYEDLARGECSATSGKAPIERPLLNGDVLGRMNGAVELLCERPPQAAAQPRRN